MDEITIALIAGAVVVLGIAGYFLYGWRARQQAEAKGAFYHVRCNGCQRRLRYQVRQVGHQGKCSNCGRSLKFPPVTESIE